MRSAQSMCCVPMFAVDSQLAAPEGKQIFLEGTKGPRSVAKCGAAADLINELIVNAKDAVDKLWKERGYDKMKPSEREKPPSTDLSIDGGLLCVSPLGVPSGHFEGGSEGVLLAPDLEPCAIYALLLLEPALV